MERSGLDRLRESVSLIELVSQLPGLSEALGIMKVDDTDLILDREKYEDLLQVSENKVLEQLKGAVE